MITDVIIFLVALTGLLVSANYFTGSAETIGKWLKFPQFVIGVFIIGMGTSLPELVGGILSVQQNASEILPGNIMGSNISNLLLVTGVAIILNRKIINLGSAYIFIDLHFLIGSFFIFAMIAYDGEIALYESIIGIIVYIAYSFYLIKGDWTDDAVVLVKTEKVDENTPFPIVALLILIAAGVGIYFAADYTITSITNIASALSIPASIVALTVLSLGTTLPELAVNISVIRKGKAEMAIGNVLGSCIFNTLMIPAVAGMFGTIQVPPVLVGFSLPVMLGAGVLFYFLAHDKRMSPWEAILLVSIYAVFMMKIAFA